MHVLVLLYDTEAGATEPGTGGFDDEMAGYRAFAERAGGAIRGGAPLELSPTARTFRSAADGSVEVADGPATSAAAVLGGYYLLEVDDLAAALALVPHIPATSAPNGGSEVRVASALETFRAEGEARPNLWLATTHDPDPDPDADADGQRADAHRRFVEDHRDHLIRTVTVTPATEATTVRGCPGEETVLPGPFPGAATVVGTVYLIEGDARTAGEIAAAIPVGPGQVIELRPLLHLGPSA